MPAPASSAPGHTRSGVPSDIVYHATGAASINLGAITDLTLWFLMPADGQQPVELTLTVP